MNTQDLLEGLESLDNDCDGGNCIGVTEPEGCSDPTFNSSNFDPPENVTISTSNVTFDSSQNYNPEVAVENASPEKSLSLSEEGVHDESQEASQSLLAL